MTYEDYKTAMEALGVTFVQLSDSRLLPAGYVLTDKERKDACIQIAQQALGVASE